MKKRIVMLMLLVVFGATSVSCGKKDEIPLVEFEASETELDMENTEIESNTSEADRTETEDIEGAEEGTIVEEAENNDYSVCTDKSAEEVEAFAAEIVSCFANEDWEGLSKQIFYPITINDKYYESQEKFVQEDWSNVFSKEFVEEIVNAEITDIWATWKGIALCGGYIWFGEIDQELKVCSINYYDGTTEADYSNGIVGHWNVDWEKTQQELKNYNDVQEMFGTGIQSGSDFTVAKDNTFSMELAIAFYITGTYEMDGEDMIITYESMYPELPGTEKIKTQTIDDKLYLVSEYDGEEIYWTKLAE